MTTPQSAQAVRPKRPHLGVDLLRMTAKITIGGLISAVIGALSFLMFSGIVGAANVAELDDPYTPITRLGDSDSVNDILVLDISGVILNHAPKSGGGLSPFSSVGNVVYGYSVKADLEAAAQTDAIKGVMLHVSTPGGAIAGSKAISDGIEAMKAAGKTVAVYVDSISASGGVWSTANADGIFADHGAVVGSVGVIGPSILEYKDPVALGGIFSGVETRGGVELHVTSAGRGKDFGNPFRSPTPQEKQQLQNIVDEMYKQFVNWVSTERGIAREVLIEQTGAGVFANTAAERLGFIDGTRTYDETIAWLAEELELGDDFRVIAPTPADYGWLGLGIVRNGGLWGRGDGGSAATGTRARTGSQGGLVRAETGPQVNPCASLRGSIVAMSPMHWASYCGF